MSTQQILGVVGFAVGSFFGYPQLGFVVGSLVGAALTPKTKTEGPRLDDLKVTVSTYGGGITILYGTERLGGNVIWSTDKIEVATTEEQGKGGGAEHTSYKYYVHMAIALCETPRDGSTVTVVKTFKDGKLVTDQSAGLTAASALASVLGTEAPSKGDSPTQPILYQGGADQLPDPTMEAWEGGPGSVAAYRGIVYILPPGVECPGGRVPQFSFVLSNVATIGEENLVYAEVPIVGSGDNAWAVIRQGQTWHFGQLGNDFDGDYRLKVFDVGSGYATPAREIRCLAGVHYGLAPCPVNGPGEPVALRMRTDPSASPANPHIIERYELSTGVVTEIFTYVPETTGNVLSPISAGYDPATEKYALRGNPSVGVDRSTVVTILSGGSEVISGTIPGGIFGPVAIQDNVVYALSADSGLLVISRFDGDDGSLLNSTAGPAWSDGTGSMAWAGLHPAEDGLYVWIRADTQNRLYLITFVGTVTWTLISNNVTTTGAEKLGNAPYATTFYASRSMAIIGPSVEQSDIHRYNVVRFNAVSLGTTKVSDIIADLCERAGETRYDVSGIPDSDVAHGYKLQNPASARANIEPLLTAFGIYIVDEDGLIKFRKYEDIASVTTISYDELGQSEGGAEPGDAMPLARAQEVDLPRSVTCSYIEPSFDYQTASEKESRQVTEATEDLQLEIPIALTSSDHAKQVAQRTLFARWLSQNTRSTKVSRKFAFVSPGDGVTIEYPRGEWSLWRLMSVTDTGGLCEWNLEPGDSELMAQTAVGATGYPGQEVSPLAPPTRMVLLDAPIMRDVDNNPGLYVAAEGFSDGWRGYTLLVGDDDTDLQDRGTVTTSVPIGYAESALGAWTPNMLDGRNSVVLSMGDDELNSTTEALLMTSRVNLALIGSDGRWEAIQFMAASSLGGGRYLIYGLLRGLYGTERFSGTHEVGDTFVLMTTAGMLRPNQDAGSLGQTKSYRPVSLGRSRESVASTSFANTGIGLLPYSPWDPRKSKAASNDQTITWERRSRLSTNALRGTVPLGEAAESYSVEFYTSSAFTTLAGTLTSTTKSLTITSAQQTAFGLTPGATLYVHIRQVSDVVGAGAPLEATL